MQSFSNLRGYHSPISLRKHICESIRPRVTVKIHGHQVAFYLFIHRKCCQCMVDIICDSNADTLQGLDVFIIRYLTRYFIELLNSCFRHISITLYPWLILVQYLIDPYPSSSILDNLMEVC